MTTETKLPSLFAAFTNTDANATSSNKPSKAGGEPAISTSLKDAEVQLEAKADGLAQKISELVEYTKRFEHQVKKNVIC